MTSPLTRGVNHALVHRYFGTKAEVVEEVLRAEAAEVVAAVSRSGLPTSGTAPAEVVSELLEVLAARPTYWRALAAAVVEAPETAVSGTAATTALFADLWRGGGPDRAASTAAAGANVLGWLVFGGFVAEATGAGADDLRQAVAQQVSRLTG